MPNFVAGGGSWSDNLRQALADEIAAGQGPVASALKGSYAATVPAPTGVAAIDTPNLQGALTGAALAGGGAVRAQRGTYVVSGLTIQSGVHLIGEGVTATRIQLAAGANADLIRTSDFATLTGTNSAAGQSEWGVHHLILDGNAGNQTAACWTLRCYGFGYRVSSVEMYGAYSGVAYSEWSSDAAGNMEAVWSDVKLLDNRGVGLDWRGPHDSTFDHVYVVSGPFGHYGDTGIWVRGASGGEMWTNVHVWGYHNKGWVFEHSGQAVNCQSEGARAVNLHILADGVAWSGQVYGTNDYHTGEVGVQLGIAPNQKIQRAVLDLRLHDFGATSVPIDVSGSNGRNIIRGNILRGSAATIFTGSIHPNDLCQLWCVDYPGQGLQNIPHNFTQLYSGTNAWQLRHPSQSFLNGDTGTVGGQKLQFAWNQGIELFTDVFATKLGPTLNASEWGALLGDRVAGEETMFRRQATLGVQTTSQRLTLTFFTARSSTVVNSVTVASGSTAAGATPTLARLGLYSVNTDNTLTLIGSTVSDTSLFASSNTVYTKALSSAVTLTAGARYAVGILVVSAAAMPTFAGAGPSASALALSTPRIAGYLTGQADLPSSVPASLTGGAGMFYASLT